MPAKFRTAIRRGLVVPLADTRGGVGGGGGEGGSAGLLSSSSFCPSCSTCRKRTLSTVALSSSSSSSSFTPTFTNCRTRNYAGLRYNPNCNTTTTVHRYLSTSIALSDTDPETTVNNSSRSNSPINRKNHVPPHLRELHAALSEVQNVAADHVSLSRLQLALRGLESEEPVIRVAILGVNDIQSTRRLVRLLLADPLTEKQPWEDLIDAYGIEESNGLLIRYGQDPGIVENNLCPTISVTSPVMQKGRIEIFVNSLGTGAEPAMVPVTDEAFFVPTITVPASESGAQHETIRYPVHRSIICGEGTDGLLAYSNLLGRAGLNSAERLAVHGVVELDSIINGTKSKDTAVTLVNVDKAEAALAKFRESVNFASEYERGWSASGVQSVADKLSITPSTTTATVLGSDLQTLVQSLLDTAEAGVTADEAARARVQELTNISAENRQRLDQSVSAWAERAHTELRNSLDEGFASRRWKALSWWKLFWRVDDVSSIMAEILQTRYLLRAEKEMIWTAGRVKQTGLLHGSFDVEDPTSKASLSEAKEIEGHPWPLQIATSRLQMLTTTIPSLQALSQGLVLFSASTVGLTSALSGLLYASASTGLYEACTIAAVGLIYSMRRQQVKWETGRSSWESEVREGGRTALVETEEVLRGLVRDSPMLQKQKSAEMRARSSIARARKALEEVRNE